MFYIIEPEVAGGFGDQTVLYTSVHPPQVQQLEYRFDGWLGDELLETFPCFIVTEALQRDIEAADLTGCVFDHVLVSTSETFDELYPGRTLPTFAWLKIHGVAGRDDFGLTPDHRLVVSERAYQVLQRHALDHAIVEPVSV